MDITKGQKWPVVTQLTRRQEKTLMVMKINMWQRRWYIKDQPPSPNAGESLEGRVERGSWGMLLQDPYQAPKLSPSQSETERANNLSLKHREGHVT